jgi:hypothetical protein
MPAPDALEPMHTRPFRVGDRIRVNALCVWTRRVGLEGMIADANPGYDDVYVLLDGDSTPSESHWPENGGATVYWTAKFQEYSLDLLEAVEDRLQLTPFQRQTLAYVEDADAWEKQGDGPWQAGWVNAPTAAAGRAMNTLARHGLILRHERRHSSKLPDSYRKLAWDPALAPKDDD